jgi:hypothetical protein
MWPSEAPRSAPKVNNFDGCRRAPRDTHRTGGGLLRRFGRSGNRRQTRQVDDRHRPEGRRKDPIIGTIAQTMERPVLGGALFHP